MASLSSYEISCFIPSREHTVRRTCSLEAMPTPVTACFILSGAYSDILIPFCIIAAIAAPLAAPSVCDIL